MSFWRLIADDKGREVGRAEHGNSRLFDFQLAIAFDEDEQGIDEWYGSPMLRKNTVQVVLDRNGVPLSLLAQTGNLAAVDVPAIAETFHIA